MRIIHNSGGILKTSVVIPILALLLVSGCGSPQTAQQPTIASASPAKETSSPSDTSKATAQASVESTCAELMGTGSNGPLFETISLIAESGAATDRATLVTTARRLSPEIHDIAKSAPQTMSMDLKNFYSPLDDIIGLDDKTRVRSNFNADSWKEAGINLLNICEPYDSGTNGTPKEPGVATPSSSKADQISAQFPGYPLLVNVASLDYRVVNWFDGKLVDGQVVALAPGLYAPYNPNVPQLNSYYESGGVAGDSAIKEAVLPNAGGATWSGVLPGAEEPQ